MVSSQSELPSTWLGLRLNLQLGGARWWGGEEKISTPTLERGRSVTGEAQVLTAPSIVFAHSGASLAAHTRSLTPSVAPGWALL